MDATPRQARDLVAASSLIVGPALTSAGDLIHPAEDMDAAAQAAIVAAAPARWYLAHLLLFAGFLVLVPGLLALTGLAAHRKPVAGRVARILMLISVGSFSAVFVFEMVLGRVVAGTAGLASAVMLLETFQSPRIFLALLPGLLAFFVGVALLAVSLVSSGRPFRWPTIVFALGAALVLAEIVSAEVVLSQIGNVAMFVASTAFALLMMRGDGSTPRERGPVRVDSDR